jgi:hypothetical protein
MRVSLGIHLWFRVAFAVILLIANIGAPFRSATSGRVFLERLRPSNHTQAVIRVRAISPSGLTQGYRAPVGLARGGSNACTMTMDRLELAEFVPSPATPPSDGVADRSIGRRSPPLRC